METSYYNFIIRGDNFSLIYNAFTNMLIDAPVRVVNLVESSIFENKPFEYENISEEEYTKLIRFGVLCNIKENQKNKVIRDIQTGINFRQKSNKIILEIHPNSDCNFNCFYCYESKASRKRQLVMNGNTLQNIYKYIETRLIAGYKDIVIAWCGGESLLSANIIIKQQSKLSLLCAQYGVKLKGEVITNGFLLTQTLGSKLVKAGVKRARITLDGPESIHNKRRIYPRNPKENYDTIIKNIVNSDEGLEISIRVNIDQYNKKFLLAFLEDLIQKKVWPYRQNVSKKIDIEVVSDSLFAQNKGLLSPEESCIVKHNFRKFLYEKYIELTKKKNAKIDFLFPSGQEICANIGYPCGWVIDTDGSLFKCSEHIGNSEVKVCMIDDIDQSIEKEQYIFKNIQPYTKLNLQKWGCLDCCFLPICRKRCAWDYQNQNGINKRCSEVKYNLETNLKWQYDLYLKNPLWFNRISNLVVL